MYWLRLGAVVPVWFCISSILQYQSQFGTNWLNRVYCPFASTFRRCIFVRQVELAPGRFVLPSGHARTQPARAFPAQTLKIGWTLLSTWSIVVLVLQALIQRFLPGFFMNGAVRKAGQRLERTEPVTCTAGRGGIYQGLHQFTSTSKLWAPLPSWWSVVPKALGNQPCWTISCVSMWITAKMCFLLEFLFVQVRTWNSMKRCPKLASSKSAAMLPRTSGVYAGTGEWDVQAPNRQCRDVVYLQLPTKSRGDKFSRDACDDIASTLGAFARNITCDHYPSKTSRLWSRRWQSKGNDFGTLNKVLADDEIEEVLKHYYIRTGGNFRALDLILRNVPREGQKGADAVIKQVEQWGERVEPIEKKLGDQEVKDYLLKVAEAGPMGYIPESDGETEMKLKLLREKPADCVLMRATKSRVALKHWHFIAKLFQEDEQKFRDAGYMWASPVKETAAFEMFCGWVTQD